MVYGLEFLNIREGSPGEALRNNTPSQAVLRAMGSLRLWGQGGNQASGSESVKLPHYSKLQ